MTQDELNELRSIRTTLDNAFVQKDIFWTREIMASGLTSLDALITRSTKTNLPKGDIPCPECNGNGVFNYSPIKGCICGGAAWVNKPQ